MPTSPNRRIATTFGVIYLLIGIFGVAATDNATLFGHNGGLLFGLFEVNIAANAVHVIIGLGLILAGASSATAAKQLGTIVGVVLLIIGVVGFFVLDSTANILAVNIATNILHLVTAVLLLATAAGTDRRPARVTA